MADVKVVRWVGHVRTFNAELKSGKIAQRNGSKDLAFEGTGLKVGDEVEYEAIKHPRGHNAAVNIKKTADIKKTVEKVVEKVVEPAKVEETKKD